MNLSNIVHESRRSTRQQETPQSSIAPCPDPHARLLQDHRQDMASALTASPYISQSPVFTRSPQPPPSPPADPNTSRTLPSIQSLIGMDRHSGVQESKGADMQQHPSGDDPASGHRPQVYGQPTVSHPNNRPISPPIDPQLFDTRIQSPTTSSTSSQFAGGSVNSAGAHQQRQPPPTSGQTGMGPLQPGQSPFHHSPYPEAPSADSPYSYSSTAVSSQQSMYAQRPLPSTFPPGDQSASANAPESNGASPIDPNTPTQWQHQHHHYISPSTSAQFPGQAQDRYVCQVCNKAFSRPSSLRIHSHSHTGEKPFLCPYKGCGKAFSVRSNMKRHERGCHGGGSGGVSSPGSQQ